MSKIQSAQGWESELLLPLALYSVRVCNERPRGWCTSTLSSKSLSSVEIESTRGVAVLFCCHWIHPVLLHHGLLWNSQQSGQEQTAADGEKCREKHLCSLSGSVHLESHKTSRKTTNTTDLCRPGRNLFQLLSSGRCYRALFAKLPDTRSVSVH